jgi:Flp pilus assembly protein CpaB
MEALVSREMAEVILTKAETLAGGSLGDNGLDIAAMAARLSLALCGRTDIPQGMEDAVAAIAVTMAQDDSSVQSIQRGDTSITYDTETKGQTLERLLGPWMRLRTVSRE